jgi:hypothetical protein
MGMLLRCARQARSATARPWPAALPALAHTPGAAARRPGGRERFLARTRTAPATAVPHAPQVRAPRLLRGAGTRSARRQELAAAPRRRVQRRPLSLPGMLRAQHVACCPLPCISTCAYLGHYRFGFGGATAAPPNMGHRPSDSPRLQLERPPAQPPHRPDRQGGGFCDPPSLCKGAWAADCGVNTWGAAARRRCGSVSQDRRSRRGRRAQ